MSRNLVLVVWALLAGPACHEESFECNCPSPGLTVGAENVQVQELQLGGPACSAPQVTSHVAGGQTSNGFVPGARSYTIMPNAEGDCTVTVLLGDGTSRQKTVGFQAIAGQSCCSGLLVADAAPQWDLVSVSPADGGTD